MSLRVEPCLVLLKPPPLKGEGRSYEIKWYGYRLATHIEPDRIRILTRGGHDWTDRFPAISEAARQLGVASAILDGEAVVYDELGGSDFKTLQPGRCHAGNPMTLEQVFPQPPALSR